MKINIICPQCSSNGFAKFFVETINEDGLYTGNCPHGHGLLVATQTLRHEMLFEIALNAIRDGYYREAISSFAASAERYYEFAIRVFARYALVSADVMKETWKQVSNQSERQFGGYVLLYTLHFHQVPKLLNTKMVELRNEVTHKGKLPRKEQAIQFGETVYDMIQGGVHALRQHLLEQVNAELGEHVSFIATKMGTHYPRSFQVTPTALNIIEDISNGYTPFRDILKGYGVDDSEKESSQVK
jgi:hypothetical protein